MWSKFILSGLVLVWSTSTYAYLYDPNPEPCEDYALKSVSQFKLAKVLKCPVSGLRWNSNEAGQAAWCKTARPAIVAGESKARAEALLQCMGNPAPLNPSDLTKNANDLGEAMIKAVAKDDIKRVYQLAAAGWEMTYQGNAGNDGSIMYVAIVNGVAKSSPFFLEKLKISPNTAGNGTASGLYYLLDKPNANLKFVEYLLKHKVDPNYMGESSWGFPLNQAVERRNLKAAQLLLKYGAKASGDPSCYTDAPPLKIAMKNRDTAMIKLLKQYGAKETDECMQR